MTLIRQILLAFIILLQIPLAAQTSSSYSRYGIGDIEYSYSARKTGMGQLGTAVSDEDFINSLNPAGWNQINRTRIEFGINYSGMTLTSEGLSKYYSDTQFSGFTIAFPVSTDYGTTIAAGLIPYSNVAYNVVEDYSSQTAGDYQISYTGSGGLGKLFFGSSFKFPFNMTIGATLDYYFGNLNYKSRVEFSDPAMQPAEYVRTYAPKGIGTTLGLISPDFSRTLDIEGITDLRVGFSTNIFSTLDTDTTLVSNRVGAVDTISGAVVDVSMPPRMHIGLGVTLSKEYLLTLDYAFQQWEELQFNNLSGINLQNSAKISAGFEYKPIKQVGNTFWDMVILRAGLTYEQTQYYVSGKDVDFYAVSTGFSLPLSIGNTLDFAIQYGVRGTADLIKENILRLSAGISLGDIWFVRQEK
jgi:hypothetical protein